jgi:hypothetical protein
MQQRFFMLQLWSCFLKRKSKTSSNNVVESKQKDRRITGLFKTISF